MIRDLMTNIGWRAALDIILVAILFYQIIAMLKGTRAAQVLIGMLVIFFAYIISSFLELETLNWIISKFYSSFIFVVIVLFQDDIRRLLTRFGRGPFVSGLDENSGLRVIDEVVNAAAYLSHDRIGALIVFERGIGLDRLYDHAVRLESLVSEQVLICIFQSFSPLHDGAVIIQKNRLTCASAQLPLSKNPFFSKKLGTRHSAAVGISEETDAVVVVVSEETRTISVAWDGQLQKQANADALRRTLIGLLMPQTEKKSLQLLRHSLTSGEELQSGLLRRFQQYFSIFGQSHAKRTSHEIAAANSFLKNKGSSHERNGASGDFQSTEMENRLASLGAKSGSLSLRLPKYAKLKTPQSEETHLAVKKSATEQFDQTDSSQITTAPGTNEFTENRRASVVDDYNHKEVTDNFSGLSLEKSQEVSAFEFEHPNFEHSKEPNALEQNKAAQALTKLTQEERLVPPQPPPPPPRDVNLGGVPLNPPLSEVERPAPAENKKKGNS